MNDPPDTQPETPPAKKKSGEFALNIAKILGEARVEVGLEEAPDTVPSGLEESDCENVT